MPDGRDHAGAHGPSKVMRVSAPFVSFGGVPRVEPVVTVQQTCFPWSRWTMGPEFGSKMLGLTMLDLFGAGPVGVGPLGPEWGQQRVLQMFLMNSGEGWATLAVRICNGARVAVTVHTPPVHTALAGGVAAPASATVVDMALPLTVAQATALTQTASARVKNRVACLLVAPGTGKGVHAHGAWVVYGHVVDGGLVVCREWCTVDVRVHCLDAVGVSATLRVQVARIRAAVGPWADTPRHAPSVSSAVATVFVSTVAVEEAAVIMGAGAGAGAVGKQQSLAAPLGDDLARVAGATRATAPMCLSSELVHVAEKAQVSVPHVGYVGARAHRLRNFVYGTACVCVWVGGWHEKAGG